jgi:hypothetical protein
MAGSRPDPAMGLPSPMSSPMVSIVVVVAGAKDFFFFLKKKCHVGEELDIN